MRRARSYEGFDFGVDFGKVDEMAQAAFLPFYAENVGEPYEEDLPDLEWRIFWCSCKDL